VKQVSGGIYARAELLYTILPAYAQNAHCRPAWHVPRVACRVPLPQEDAAFTLPPILTFLGHFLPDRMTLSLQGWHLDETAAQLTLQVTTRARVRCPLCQTPTARVHSRYTRTLTDLPWGSYTLRLQLHVRKFFCDHPACARQIFTERLPTVAAPWARRTLRLAEHLRACGLALGGELGARLGHRLGLRTSPDTLRRLVQDAPTPAATAPQALGVDEWGLATRATLRHDPGQSGRSPGAGPLARALGGSRRPLADPASDRDRGLSGPECPLCGGHSPWRPSRGPGRGSISSGQKPAGSYSRLSCTISALLYRPPRRARRRPSRRWPARWRPRPCIGGDTSPPRLGNNGRRRRNSSGTPLGVATLRGHPRPPRPRDAGHHHCRAARDQPSHRGRLSAADPAPESAQPAALRPGWCGRI